MSQLKSDLTKLSLSGQVTVRFLLTVVSFNMLQKQNQHISSEIVNYRAIKHVNQFVIELKSIKGVKSVVL